MMSRIRYHAQFDDVITNTHPYLKRVRDETTAKDRLEEERYQLRLLMEQVNKCKQTIERLGRDAEPTQATCNICLEAICRGDAVVLQCGHVYHMLCVKTLLKHDRRCPECREIISPPPCTTRSPSRSGLAHTLF